MSKNNLLHEKFRIKHSRPTSIPHYYSIKERFFFLLEYKILSSNEEDKTISDSIWIEYVWKNVIVNGKRTKERLDGIQLIVNSKKISSLGYLPSDFLINWSMEIEANQLPGSGISNETYVFYLKSNSLPDSIKILFKEYTPSKSQIKRPQYVKLIKSSYI